MRTHGFGRRSAIPDAWLLSRYRLPIPLKCSRRPQWEVPPAPTEGTPSPTEPMTLILYSRTCFAGLVEGSPVEEEGPGQFVKRHPCQSPHSSLTIRTDAFQQWLHSNRETFAGRQADCLTRGIQSGVRSARLSAGQLISAINMPPALDSDKVRQSSIPESGSLYGVDVEPTINSAPNGLDNHPVSRL